MEQGYLFDSTKNQPLASRLRPRNLDEFVGQMHLIGEGKVLKKLIENDQITSLIFWDFFKILIKYLDLKSFN